MNSKDTTNSGVQDYLSQATQRLVEQRFHINRNVSYKGQAFEYTAQRTRFEIEKGGLATTFYVFARLPSINIGSLREFSAKSFKYALRASGFRPPRGLFYSMFCFPVAIVNAIDTNTVTIVRRKAPPAHWAAFEMLVVFSLTEQKLYYCEITPEWGKIYYNQMRQTIQDTLTP